MEKRKSLKLDMGELCSAMEESSYEHDYYLDLKTGEILLLSDYVDDEDQDILRNKIEGDRGRYEPIPKTGSFEGYQDMRDFIASIGDERISEVLETAIQGRGAFRRFKDVLIRYPEERDRWFKFKDDRMFETAKSWLDDIGVNLLKE